MIIIRSLLVINSVLFFSINSIAQPNNELMGRWELMKIKNDSMVQFVDSGKYIVIFSEKSINFNRSVNKCFGLKYKITKSNIYYDQVGCTKACCDDEFSSNLNYSGEYKFNEAGSLLEIKNKTNIDYLKRKN